MRPRRRRSNQTSSPTPAVAPDPPSTPASSPAVSRSEPIRTGALDRGASRGGCCGCCAGSCCAGGGSVARPAGAIDGSSMTGGTIAGCSAGGVTIGNEGGGATTGSAGAMGTLGTDGAGTVAGASVRSRAAIRASGVVNPVFWRPRSSNVGTVRIRLRRASSVATSISTQCRCTRLSSAARNAASLWYAAQNTRHAPHHRAVYTVSVGSRAVVQRQTAGRCEAWP